MDKPMSFFLAALNVNPKDVRGVLASLRQGDGPTGRAGAINLGQLERRAAVLRKHTALVTAVKRETRRLATKRAPR